MTVPTALVTGANRGLGFAIARQLGRHGVRTIIGSRDRARGELAAATLRDEGFDAFAVTLDVDSAASVRAAAAEVAERIGRLDLLVNNAGILPEATAPSAATPVDTAVFERTFETNVFGAVRMIQSFLPLLLEAPAARIVNVSSTMGSLQDQSDPTSPYFGVVVPAYQASKAALNAVTIAVAKSLVDTTVTVSSICPGWVQTDLGGPANRAAAPLTAEAAARVVVEEGCLSPQLASGQFVGAAGSIPW